jgi:hypothetical protein
MSNIDDKISDYKQIIADLEKQKKDEEEAYRDTINKKLSNDYDNVISRLKKLEEENTQLKICLINYDMRLDKLEEENRQLKNCQVSLDILENKFNTLKYIEDSEDWFDDIERKMEDILGIDSIVHELDYRLDILESENEIMNEKIYNLENKNVIENILESNSIHLISF